MSHSATYGTFKNHMSSVFVETGTYHGDGVKLAIQVGYDRIISIEINDHYYLQAVKEFIRFPKVSIVHGDSGKVLGDVISSIGDRITFWLDGHVCYPTAHYVLDTPEVDYPLMKELTAIKEHQRNDHTIMIDDWKAWEKTNIVGWGQDEILEKVLDINEDYVISYEANTNTNYGDMVMIAELKGC
jgi:hypothetical protein